MKKKEKKNKPEFIVTYRPKNFEDVYGQEKAIDIIQSKLKGRGLPHAILLHGPYGTGKTTIAKLIGDVLSCSEFDFVERNTADYRGIDDIRKIRNVLGQAPIDGPVKIWMLDEAHKITNDGQNALLKILEDVPNHVYFILATTDPEKLLGGIQQRCLRLKLNPLETKDLRSLLLKIYKKEGIEVNKKVISKIIEYSDGSAREALQILDKIYQLPVEKQLDNIERTSVKTMSIEIARKLIKTGTKWEDIRPILNDLKNEDAEQIRNSILGYGKSVLLNTENARAFRMITLFSDNFFDSKFAGVVGACYEIICE